MYIIKCKKYITYLCNYQYTNMLQMIFTINSLLYTNSRSQSAACHELLNEEDWPQY